MTDLVVADASALVALLLDAGPSGEWATERLSGCHLLAPHLVIFEVANVLRRQELGRRIGADQAAQAHADLLALAIELWPYELLASRARELRHNLSAYDASYVSLAELAGAPLVTLDRGIAGASGIRCAVTSP